MKQCPKYSINSRCIPKCGAYGGRCTMHGKDEWCPIKIEEVADQGTTGTPLKTPANLNETGREH